MGLPTAQAIILERPEAAEHAVQTGAPGEESQTLMRQPTPHPTPPTSRGRPPCSLTSTPAAATSLSCPPPPPTAHRPEFPSLSPSSHMDHSERAPSSAKPQGLKKGASVTTGSFSVPSCPTSAREDSGPTAWPASGGHLRGPGLLPAVSLLGAQSPADWFGGSEVGCRGRRSSPGGGEIGAGICLDPVSSTWNAFCPPSPLPSFAFCPRL